MGLWIRSQNNEKLRPMLLKANEFEIGDYDEDMNCIVVNNLYCVGVYKTKERALEVLDEIQENIEKQGQTIILTDERGIPNGSKFFSYVYEMPEK